MFFPRAYRNALKLQKVMFDLASNDAVEAKDRATCAGKWIDLERLKRDMRGVSDPPKLSARVDVSLNRRAKRVRIESAPGPVLDAEQVPPVMEPVRQDETSVGVQDSSTP